MPTRTSAVAAAVGAAVFATTGITYASPAMSTQAAPAVRKAAPSVQRAVPPVQQAHPATAPAGSGNGNGNRNGNGNGNRGEGGDRGGRGHGNDREDGGNIYFNERTYSALGEGCFAAASGLGSNSFSIFNDSRRVVEVYRGFNCNNGSPVATVGPYGSTYGVATNPVNEDGFGGAAALAGAVFSEDGVVGSFRVLGHHDEW